MFFLILRIVNIVDCVLFMGCVMFMIFEVKEGEVFCLVNYLLVGVILYFDLEVFDVWVVMEEELVYGYVYGFGGYEY